MRRILVWMVISAAVMPAPSARADWQYVKWGMTKKAAVEASKGEAMVVSGDRNAVCAFTTQTPFAKIPRKLIGAFEFQVTFCTDGGDRVTSVALSPTPETNLPTLKRSLVSQYGAPTGAGSTLIWNDHKTGNTISYYDVGGVVGRVEYKKMAATGL